MADGEMLVVKVSLKFRESVNNMCRGSLYCVIVVRAYKHFHTNESILKHCAKQALAHSSQHKDH